MADGMSDCAANLSANEKSNIGFMKLLHRGASAEKVNQSCPNILFIMADQGFFLGDHDWFDKRFMYEESLRMPFLIRYAGKIKAGMTQSDMILDVDFAPTFLEYAGLPIPSEIQGRSFVSLLNGEHPKDWRKEMYYRYYHIRAITRFSSITEFEPSGTS